MSRRYELLIFDWDGTLMDSIDRIVRCFRNACTDVGVPAPAVPATRHVIGLGLTEAIEQLLPQEDAATRARVVQRYREHFLHLDHTAMPLYAGVRAGLERLAEHGYLLAVATGKSRRGLARVLEGTGLAPLFVATRCADEAFSKPHPRMLEDLLAHTGQRADAALMIGDTVYDLQMARAASMDSLAVSYGVHAREALLRHEPLACLDSFEAVCRWLRLPGPTAPAAATTAC
jgi:phosphoglycolate phosphatase